MTVDTSRKATSYPYSVTNAAEAVRLFFAERVRVSDPKMSGGASTPEMHERICDLLASAVTDRLCVFWDHKPFGVNEEITFTFKKIGELSDTYGLTSPVPILEDLEYRFHGVGIYLRGRPHNLASAANGTFALRVSAKLVTFAGTIVWSNHAE